MDLIRWARGVVDSRLGRTADSEGTRTREHERELAPDEANARSLRARRFALACMAILNGGGDPGSVAPAAARTLLRTAWGIASEDDAERVVRELVRGPSVYGWLRAMHVARMAAAAKLVTPERSWQLVAFGARRIHARFDSFEAVAERCYRESVAQAHTAGRKPIARVEVLRERRKLRERIWSHTRFSLVDSDRSAA